MPHGTVHEDKLPKPDFLHAEESHVANWILLHLSAHHSFVVMVPAVTREAQPVN